MDVTTLSMEWVTTAYNKFLYMWYKINFTQGATYFALFQNNQNVFAQSNLFSFDTLLR